MAKHTKIIEFFGLPACGKSTLQQELCNDRPRLFEKPFKPKGLKERILFTLCFSPRLLFLALKVASFSNYPLKTTLRCVRSLIYIKYSAKRSNRAYIAVDHGIIQTTVSFENGSNLHLDEKKLNVMNKLIKETQRMMDISFVYCNVDISIALDRIKKRNRNEGRIDMLKEEQRESAYRSEKERFDFFYNHLKNSDNDCYEIEMNSSTQDAKEQLMDILNKKAE